MGASCDVEYPSTIGYYRSTQMATAPPLKVDPDTDAIITHGAHFLGMTKKALVAQAVRAYIEVHRSEIESGVRDASTLLDRSHISKVALISGLTPEEIKSLGGVGS